MSDETTEATEVEEQDGAEEAEATAEADSDWAHENDTDAQ